MLPVMEEQVQSKLQLEGHYHLVDAVHLLPKGLQEAIMEDALPLTWYMQMRERTAELKRGHLSSMESDSAPGAIHWFEGRY